MEGQGSSSRVPRASSQTELGLMKQKEGEEPKTSGSAGKDKEDEIVALGEQKPEGSHKQEDKASASTGGDEGKKILEVDPRRPGDSTQEKTVARDLEQPPANRGTRALPGLLGNDLKSISKLFNVTAATVGLGLLLAFLGITMVPNKSLLHSASTSTCRVTPDDIARLYAVVGVGLAIAITQYLASLLGASEKEETAEPPVAAAAPVMRRVFVFIAAVSQLGLTVCFFWSLMLAVSLRMGKAHCWPQGTMAAMLTGMAISSMLSVYMVYIGIACVFGANTN
ncbi:uncharacterized protein LOC119311401 [Triticum dicoccoides]|uniref:uncharacterized protein LOC119311401 n=1 Tax=Triticum dicoccoides TaxID=85692 RepID=UPI00188FE666|nr:uncharacterized protein LOC119311401 [Triticum dicoccoides]